MNEELIEEIEDDYDNYFESEDWKKHKEWMARARKKTIQDYKEFRKHTNIPYDYIKDELEGLEFVESVGFFTGFNEVQRYDRTCYQIHPEDIEPLRTAMSDPYLNWFDKAIFDKQEGCWAVHVPELETEEDDGYRTIEWEEYCHQRTEWDDCYYGFSALRVTCVESPLL